MSRFLLLAVTLVPNVGLGAETCKQALAIAEGAKAKVGALEGCGDEALAAQKPLVAASHFAAAAKLTRHDLRRRRQLLVRRRRASQKAKATKSAELAKEVMAADKVMARLIRRPRRSKSTLSPALTSLQEARRVYRRDRDPRVEETLALEALIRVRAGEVEEGRRTAERLLDKRSDNRHASMLLQEALAHAHLAEEDLPKAASAAIRMNTLRNEDVPEPARHHRRAALLERTCKRFGLAECTKLELRLTGDVTFTDFSRGRRKSELSAEDIDLVHAQALPALQACVLDAARKEPEFYRGADIKISWSIRPDGIVEGIDLSPKRNQSDIMPCAQARLTRLRYPRVRSQERKNVVIPYHLD